MRCHDAQHIDFAGFIIDIDFGKKMFPPALRVPVTLLAHLVSASFCGFLLVLGLLYAFGALYVGVNDYENKIPSGLYRITSSNGGDSLDKVELLRAMEARGDHGVHAVVPTPDGKSLFLEVREGERVVGRLQWDRYR